MIEMLFSHLMKSEIIIYGLINQKVCEALTFLLDNICIRSGYNLCRQIVGIPMGTSERIINLMLLKLSILLLDIWMTY